jgi:hypothetical protein
MVQEDILDYQESVMQLVSGMKRGGDVMPARNKKILDLQKKELE